MNTIPILPDTILSFIDFANQSFLKTENSPLDAIVDEFNKIEVATINSIINIEISRIPTAPFDAPKGWDTNQILLEVNKHFSLGISILHVSPPHLLNSVANAVYKVAGKHSFKHVLYKLPETFQRDVFDPELRPTSACENKLDPGEILRIHAGVDLIDWKIEEPVVLLRLITAPQESIQWTFRKNPIRPWFVASVDPDATQLSALFAYFGAVGYAPAAIHIAKLLGHRNHQVRWEATKALWKVDKNLGLRALQASLADPHPHVRNAATKTMAKFND